VSLDKGDVLSDLNVSLKEAAPFIDRHPPSPPTWSGSGKKWGARFTVLLMVAVAITAGGYLARVKLNRSAATAASLDIGTVTLTAVPVPVQAVKGGQVTSVLVHPQDQVSLGAPLGTLRVTTLTPTGRTKVRTTTMRAPTAGIIADDPIATGNTLQDGQTFAVLYDPADLTLVADVPLSELTKLREGMTATLSTSGLTRPIKAVVRRAVPRVGGNQAGVASDRVEIVLSPSKPAAVATLIPGLRFTGVVDLKSGTAGRSGSNLLTSK
jgi:multidrug resistance efflux pump